MRNFAKPKDQDEVIDNNISSVLEEKHLRKQKKMFCAPTEQV